MNNKPQQQKIIKDEAPKVRKIGIAIDEYKVPKAKEEFLISGIELGEGLPLMQGVLTFFIFSTEFEYQAMKIKVNAILNRINAHFIEEKRKQL